MNEVEAVKAAIKSATCPGREGPFGGYDYGHNEAFYGPAPKGGRYVIRDFRDPKSPDWGKWLHSTNDREEHEAMFAKMTDDHIAQAAIAALDAARGDVVARIAAWLRAVDPASYSLDDAADAIEAREWEQSNDANE